MLPESAEFAEYRVDDDLLAATRADRQARLRIYRVPELMVVLGRGSKPELEISAAACAADEVPVLRRSGGGCAVVLDPGNLIVSVALPTSGLGGNRDRFHRLSAWLIAGLARSGVSGVTTDGISDLVLRDRKVSGSCIHQWHDLVYYSATLLVSADLARLTRYLPHPPREPEYRRGRPHEQFCTRLVDQCPELTAQPNPEEWLAEHLRGELRLGDLTC